MSAVTIKSAQELEYMREAGRILASVHQTLGDALCEGMSPLEIDRSSVVSDASLPF